MSNKVRGEQLYLFLNGHPVGCSTECSINFNASLVEVAAAGGWSCFRSGKKVWSIGCSGFYFDDTELPANFVKGAQAVGTKVTVAMTVLARALIEQGINLDSITPDALHTVVGEAIIKDCQYTGQRGSLATYSIQLQGTGAIKNI